MTRRLTAALTTIATAMTMLAIVGASPSTSAQRPTSSLRATPTRFVGGQALTFVGRIPGAANKDLKIQTLFNRAGDRWITRPGVVGRTNGQGEFRFTHVAPSNYKIRYRVKAVGGRASKAIQFEPRQQEVTISLNGGAAQKSGRVVSGRAFRIHVNTTPTGRGDLGRPPPAFPGRPIALQQRVTGGQWSTVASTTASQQGTAQFTLTAGAPGTTAYRVRQAAITSGANDIGWFPSFPLEVRVVSTSRSVPASARTTSARASTSSVPVATTSMPTTLARSGGGGAQASSRYKWGPTQWDFAWETGEALTDKPSRGRKIAGAWIDRSNGSGRAAPYNGGMALSSHVSEFPGKGDHGSNSVTLEGNALTYGRWEFRRRIDVFERKGRDYRVKIDLVPARAEDARCGANTINVSSVGFNSRKANLGVTSSDGKRSWSGSRRIPRLGSGPHTFGVEVTRSHITWFLNGRSLATVKNRRAVPGVPLTPRLSLVGKGNKEMRRTRVLYDWQRGWSLNKQARTAQRGPALKVKNRRNAC